MHNHKRRIYTHIYGSGQPYMYTFLANQEPKKERIVHDRHMSNLSLQPKIANQEQKKVRFVHDSHMSNLSLQPNIAPPP